MFFYGAMINYSAMITIAKIADIKKSTSPMLMGGANFTLGFAALIGNSLAGFIIKNFSFEYAMKLFSGFAFIAFIFCLADYLLLIKNKNKIEDIF
jgi:hypothetical protein